MDRKFNRIYSWARGQGLVVVRDAPLDPVNLVIDASGALLVQSSFGPETGVYSFRPDAPANALTMIAPTPAQARPNARTVLPVNFWNNGEFRDQLNPDTYEFTTLAEMFARDAASAKTHEYVSPHGSLVMPAFKLLARRGGESAAVGRDGNTYVANGQVFVYAPDGREVDCIDVPERPLQLVFGGADGRTLFILTHRSLYAVRR